MRYNTLGNSGLQVSAIGLGSWATVADTLDDGRTADLLAAAYDLGITVFDTAETYLNGEAEAALGRALAKLRWPRETYVLCGKVFYGTHKRRPGSWGLSRKHVLEGCEATLRRLGVDHVDLFMCHRYDPATPLLETVRAMSDLVARGRVHYWGTSEWTPEQVRAAHELAIRNGLVPPLAEQLQYNMLERSSVETAFAPLRSELGLGVTVWSPLAYGLLAGRYDAGIAPGSRLGLQKNEWLRRLALGERPDDTLSRVRAVNALAREIGLAPAQLAMAWVLRSPHVDVAITGASNPSQLRATVAALDVADQLDEALLRRIEEALGATGGG